MSYRIPLTNAYLCHTCDAIVWALESLTCEECGVPMKSIQKMYEKYIIRVRANLAKNGVEKATATEANQQPLAIESNQLAAYLTEFRTSSKAA